MLQHITRTQRVHELKAGNQIKFDFPLSEISEAAQGAMDLIVFFKDGSYTAIRDFYRHNPTIIHGDREFEADEFLAALADGSLDPEEDEEEYQRQHDYEVMDAIECFAFNIKIATPKTSFGFAHGGCAPRQTNVWR